MSANDLKVALDGYEYEDEDCGYSSAADYMYYEGGDIELDDGRKVKHVQSYRSWPMNDPMINVVVEFEGRFYHNSSYYDSWGEETAWDDEYWSEVEQVEVVTKEWRVVK